MPFQSELKIEKGNTLILEGLLTTIDFQGGCHLSAMGPRVNQSLEQFLLRPYQSSGMFGNLCLSRSAVFHTTDDVLLLARVVTGSLTNVPLHRSAMNVQGFVLEESCHAWELSVESIDASHPRAEMVARVVGEHAGRSFLGFNRARHAVLEGAILVTRLGMLDHAEIVRQFRDLKILVTKTGGDREHEAFAILESRVQEAGPGEAIVF